MTVRVRETDDGITVGPVDVDGLLVTITATPCGDEETATGRRAWWLEDVAVQLVEDAAMTIDEALFDAAKAVFWRHYDRWAAEQWA